MSIIYVKTYITPCWMCVKIYSTLPQCLVPCTCVLWKSTNKTQVQATRHCSIYFLTHPAGVYIGVGTYYDHRCLLYQLAQRCQHPVCALPFTTTLISLGLIASAELLPFPSSDLGRNCCLSSLSELSFIVSSFNCKGQRRSEKPAHLHTK